MKKLVAYIIVGACLFLVLGVVGVLNSFNGYPLSGYMAYCTLTFPFAVVLVVLGLLGVWLMVKSKRYLDVDGRKATLLLIGGFLLIVMVMFMLDFVALPRA